VSESALLTTIGTEGAAVRHRATPVGLTTTLHPDVDATLERIAVVDRVATGILRDRLTTMLAGVSAGPWGADTSWQFSRLTSTGMPVELSFASDRPELRATVEVAGPQLPEGRRLAAAVDVAQRLGAQVPVDIVAAVVPRQRAGALQWGARLSVGSDGTSTTMTLYAETPSRRVGSATPGPCGRLDKSVLRAMALAPSASQLRMVGVEAGSEAVELRLQARLDTWSLGILCRRFGHTGRDREIVAILAELGGRPADVTLRSGRIGWSITERSRDRSGSLAIVIPASALCRSDTELRRRLLTAAGRHGWDLSRYDAAAGPLAVAHCAVHGQITIAVADDMPPAVHVGLRPFAPTSADAEHCPVAVACAAVR